MANAISKAVNKIIKRQKRKQALARAGSALTTAGKAVALLGAVAGTVLVVRAAARQRAATAATAVGAKAIRARVKREKASR